MNRQAVAAELVKIAESLIIEDTAEDIAADVSSRMDAGMSVYDAFKSIGYAKLWALTRDADTPYQWEQQPHPMRVRILTKAIEKAMQRSASSKVAYGYHKSYYGDPYWLTLKWPAHCDKCKKPLNKGERAFYYPRSKSFFGESCGHGEEAERDFHSNIEVEEGHLIGY